MPQEMERLMEERIARNQATFREANERIGAAAGVYDVATPVPFICECADPACTEVVRLELDRAQPRDTKREEVIARGEEYAIVRKKRARHSASPRRPTPGEKGGDGPSTGSVSRDLSR